MNAIILTQNKHFPNEKTTATPQALSRLCGRTLLERHADKLIASGIEKAFVRAESFHDETARIVNRYDNADKIVLTMSDGSEQFEGSDLWLVCDTVNCADIDIQTILNEAPLSDLAGTAYLNGEDSDFAFGILHKNDIKLFDFTNTNGLNAQNSNLFKSAVKLNNDMPYSDFYSYFLFCQAKLLNIYPGNIVNLSGRKFNGATLIPPVYIGKDVVIGAGAVIEQGSVIDDGARVCSGARVSDSYVGCRSIVGRNCTLNGAYICDDAVLMNRVRLPKNSVTESFTCVRSNTVVPENTLISELDGSCHEKAFRKGFKSLEFDDDGICSLFDGTVDVSAFAELGKAIGTALSADCTVCVGYSDIPAAKTLCEALCCGAVSTGVDVITVGRTSVPQLAFAQKRCASELAVFVGIDSNGDVRLMQQGGLPLMTRLEQDICHSFDRKAFRSASTEHYGSITAFVSSKLAYQRFLAGILPGSFSGLNADIRTSDRLTAEICERLFKPRNDLDGSRVVFQLSPDLSEVSAYSEETGNVRWERLCLLGCLIAFKANKPVSLPYSVPNAAEALAAAHQGTVLRYCTVNVGCSDAKARETAACDDNSFVRDGLMLAAVISSYLSDNRLTLAQALSDIPVFSAANRFVSCNADLSSAQAVSENAVPVASEGFTVSDEHTRAFVRPSKNRRSLMIFAESVSSEFASDFCDRLSEKLADISHFG